MIQVVLFATSGELWLTNIITEVVGTVLSFIRNGVVDYLASFHPEKFLFILPVIT